MQKAEALAIHVGKLRLQDSKSLAQGHAFKMAAKLALEARPAIWSQICRPGFCGWVKGEGFFPMFI